MGAALFLLSFRAVARVEPGFDAENVYTARIWLPQPNIPEAGPYFEHGSRVQFYRRVLERIASLPGVESVAAVSRVPLSGSGVSRPFFVEGRSIESGPTASAQPFLVTPGYFDTLHIPLLAGRLFDDADDAGKPGVLGGARRR